MRAALVLGILLVLGALGFLLWSGGARPVPVVVPPASVETRGAPADPTPGGTRQAVEPAPAPVEPELSAEVRVRKDEQAFWRRCSALPPDEVRDCIRAGLGASVPTPAELAAMACAGGAPDGADFLLGVEVVHRWDPAEVPARIAELGGLCAGSEDLSIALVRDLYATDPAWCNRVAASIRPELAFSEAGEGRRSVLVLAHALAEVGFQDLRLLLEAGARGDFGGSDEQGAFALVNAWALQGEEPGRIEFLSSVVDAPNFRGRAQEMRNLVECAIDPAIVEEDVGAALRLWERILSRPQHAHDAARILLDLHRLARLPRWLTTGQGGALLARAKELAGGPAGKTPR
jgi:hypothetical protein